MEQAVNQFNKGLQMDTNPMLQGNNSLTDCLNGTLVTMNGNEIILLNDMGNRKVDQAYLPPGYEPVGIKEYGGVIYLALYNPITNRSQIGSFPSPDLRILNDITYKNSFDLTNLSKTVTKNTLLFLANDTMLVPLTSSNLIRIGDKFSIYIDDDEFWNTYIEDNGVQLSNYNNTYGEKIISPKNKLYTLLIGILNPKNEFVDITPTLQRWIYKDNKEELLSFNNGLSQNYINNAGYFIKRLAPSTEIEAEDDENLLKERLKLALNTYSYKLVGPLYLKAKLNHPTDFSYNITGSKVTLETSTGLVTKLQLTINGTLTYNCPDGVVSVNINDPVYQTLGEGYNSEINGFDLYLEKSTTTNDISKYQREINVDYHLSPDEMTVPEHATIEPIIDPISRSEYLGSRATEDTQIALQYIVKDSDLIRRITNVVYAYDLIEPNAKIVSKVTYNGENYKVQILKSYEITLNSEDETKNFYIAVPCKLVPVLSEPRIYINDLFSQFSINFSLLEEDKVTLTDWRYTIGVAEDGDNIGKEVINIKMTLQSYLKGNELIEYVNLDFADWRTISTVSPVSTSVHIDDFSDFTNTDTDAYILRTYDIETQLLLKSEDEDNPYEFLKRVLYNVSMSCTLLDTDEKILDVYNQAGKSNNIAWLLTTELFNNVDANLLNTENIKDLLKITPTGNVVLSKNSSSPELISSTGKFVSPTLDDLNVSYTYNEVDEFTATCNIETFADKSLYPLYLDVLEEADLIKYDYNFDASRNGVLLDDEGSANTLIINTKFTDKIEKSGNESKVTVNNIISPFNSTDVLENGNIHMGFVLYNKKLFLVCSDQISLDYNIVTKSEFIRNATTIDLVQNLSNNDFNISSNGIIVYKIGEAAVDFYVFRILSYTNTNIISAILKRILLNNPSLKCNWFNIMFYDLKPSPTYQGINFYNVVWRDPNFPLLDSQVENYVEQPCDSCESIKNATTFVFWKYTTGSEEGFRLLDLIEVEAGTFPQPGIRRTDYETLQDYFILDNYDKYNKNYKVVYEYFSNHVLGNVDNDYYLCQNDSRELYKLSSNSTITKTTTTILVSCDVVVKYLSDILSILDNAPIKFEVANESFSTTYPQYVIEKNYDDILNLDISNLLISEEGFTTDNNGDLFVANSLYLKLNGKYFKVNLPDITIKDEFPIFNSKNELIAFENTILKESYNANQCYFVVGPWIPYFKTSDL